MPASWFSLFHLPCLLKIRKSKHFFSYGKAVLPSQFSQLNTSQGASSAIQGLNVIPQAWWIALKWRHCEKYQLSRCTLDQHGWTTPPPPLPPSEEGAGAHPAQEEGFNGRRDMKAQQTWAGAQPHVGRTSPKCEPAFTTSEITCCNTASLGDSFSTPLFDHLISDFFIPTTSS